MRCGRIGVEADDAAFDAPTKPIGPVHDAGRAAACRFARAVGRAAAIGPLDRIEALLAGDAGSAVLPV